ncbi:MAG: hypothetical protein LRY33_01720, partial [Parabacteroides chartae]|nr:hypothetical protein [Parabacteroides chartae]
DRFDLYHEVKLQIVCKTKKYAKELLGAFENSTYIDNDEYRIQLPNAEHSSYKNSYNSICAIVEQIFEEIPELEE